MSEQAWAEHQRGECDYCDAIRDAQQAAWSAGDRLVSEMRKLVGEPVTYCDEGDE